MMSLLSLMLSDPSPEPVAVTLRAKDKKGSPKPPRPVSMPPARSSKASPNMQRKKDSPSMRRVKEDGDTTSTGSQSVSSLVMYCIHHWNV